jgi:DNA repair protein RadC
MMLDTRYNFVSYNLVSLGSLSESIAHPRDVFRPAVVAGAYAIVLMHNHPSGDPSPSQADHSLTLRLKEAGELLQVHLLDHVIAGEYGEGRQSYFSFRDAGVL